MPCELCKIINEKYRIIEINDNAFCIVIKEPLNNGHVMVLPKRHVTDLSKLTPKESKDINKLIKSAEKKINKHFDNDVVVFMNTKSHSSQKHLHFHVLPSKAGLREFIAKYENIPEKKEKSKKELEEIKKNLLSK